MGVTSLMVSPLTKSLFLIAFSLLFGCSTYDDKNHEKPNDISEKLKKSLKSISGIDVYSSEKNQSKEVRVLNYLRANIEGGSSLELGFEGYLKFDKCVIFENHSSEKSDRTALIFPEGSAYFDENNNFWFRGKKWSDGEKLSGGALVLSEEERSAKIKECDTNSVIFISY